MDSGYFALMLHAHMPYCRKSGRWPAGEEWLFEAMYETYLPLLMKLRQFQKKNLKPRLMLGVVPILAEQLSDPYMNNEFCFYIEDKIKRAEGDLYRFSDPKHKAAAEFWLNHFNTVYDAYKNHFFRNVMGTLKWLQEEGVIEVVTSAATHGFLPLLEDDAGINAQVELGIQTYKKYFYIAPKGFWLPECAYRPKKWNSKENYEMKGIDEWLARAGVQYFFVENVGIERAHFVENQNGENHPNTSQIYRLESGVHVVARNMATSKQVWSPDFGYPGDPFYREFHSKDSESGLHYHRVTGQGMKEVYEPLRAQERVNSHADHFISVLQKEVNNSHQQGLVKPIIESQYDCELFGHWWFEGVNWIEAVYHRLLSSESQNSMNLPQSVSISDYIELKQDSFSTIEMGESSWGENSDFTVWTHPDHNWIWPYINSSISEFRKVVESTDISNLSSRGLRILRQTGRELLLMEGSDWPFLLYTEQAKDYANQRFHNHHQRFNKLIWAAKNLQEPHRISDSDLSHFEDIDNPWSELDLDLFKRPIE